MNKISNPEEKLVALEKWISRQFEGYAPVLEPCVMCGELTDMEQYHYSSELRICAVCAEKAANLYWMQHSGEYLTWPNAPRDRQNNRKTLSATKRLEIWQRDGFKCVECGSETSLTVDHILAVSKGGTNDDSNLRTLCKSCNSRKGARSK
jgi:HNH endonuclease